METYDSREAIPVKMKPRMDGAFLGFGTYTANEFINGSKDNLKCWLHVVNFTDAKRISTSAGGLITTDENHGLATGDWVTPTDHDGNTGINGSAYQITVTGDKTFTLTGVSGSIAGTGGMIYPIVKSADATPIVLKEILLARHATDANAANYTIRKGAIVNTEKVFGMVLWYDSTGGASGGYRIYDLILFKVRERQSLGPVPYA